MLQLMRVPAPYFFALATILLDKMGKPDPFGTTFDSGHCEICGSADRATLVVRCKDIDRDNRGGVAASRGPEGETFTGLHTRIASHMEHQAGLCFLGEHVFAFSVAGADGEAGLRHVAGLDLRDAKRSLMKAEPGLEIRDIAAVRTPGEFAEGLPEGTPVVVTEALAADRAGKARIKAAEACTDDVHLIGWRDPAEGQGSRTREAAPVLALDIADAVAFFRAFGNAPEGVRIVRVEVLTMPEYLAAKGKAAPEPARTSGLVAREAHAAGRIMGLPA